MKAAYIEKVGPPENIRYGDLPVPALGTGDVLVKVSAVCVNPRGHLHPQWPVPHGPALPLRRGAWSAGHCVRAGEGSGLRLPDPICRIEVMGVLAAVLTP
jgi:NADPH:quinone reductase-like Zn-dependent oxidoreductase